MNRESIRDVIIRIAARDLKIEPALIDPGKSILALGVDSVGAVTMIADLEKELGIPIEASLVFEAETIDSLAGELAVRVNG